MRIDRGKHYRRSCQLLVKSPPRASLQPLILKKLMCDTSAFRASAGFIKPCVAGGADFQCVDHPGAVTCL